MPTLLVVDDEPSILHFFRRAFPGPEVTLLTGSSAAEGEALVSRERPDVVILDVNLPDGSGLEAFRRIHASDPRIPVIFITARDEQAARDEAESLGGAGSYLPKPFFGRDLIDAVTRALR